MENRITVGTVKEYDEEVVPNLTLTDCGTGIVTLGLTGCSKSVRLSTRDLYDAVSALYYWYPESGKQ